MAVSRLAKLARISRAKARAGSAARATGNFTMGCQRMSTPAVDERAPQPWRRALEHELFEYIFNFAFLAIFLVAFAWYRRLILASYHIEYLSYFVPLLEAAILAKVIMLGDLLHLGRGFRDKPLAVVTIYRTLVFTVFIVLFSICEHMAGALVHGKSAAEGIAEIADKGRDQLLAWCLLIVVALLPFFAIKELERVLGAKKVRELFFKNTGKVPIADAD